MNLAPKNSFLILLFLIFNLGHFVFSQPAGYSYGKQILINASQIPGTTNLINFPLLFSRTDPNLRHVSNGGHVQNVNGYDIVFTLGDCSTILSHEIESYNPTTGSLVAWVRIPSLSATVNTGIHMYYGNNLITANPSTSATWNAGYDGVWHLHNDFLDASGNGNNGTNNGSTDVSPAFLADGQHFVDPNNWIELTNHPNRTGSFSYSGWFYSNDVTRSGQRIICDDATNANGCHAISLGDPGTGQLRFYIRGLTPVSLDTPNMISNNTWYHVVVVYDSASLTKYLYVNGVLVISGTVTGTLGIPTGNASIGGEVASGETDNRFHGNLDEIRAIPGVLSANWVTAEYNNQSNPSTFYTISSEMTANDLCLLLPIELLNFEALLNEDGTVSLTWVTASEINNDYFLIEKSSDGEDWISLSQIDGQGNSSIEKKYSFTDNTVQIGVNYYRLKQTDFDGKFTYSRAIAVKVYTSSNAISIYPNPAESSLVINSFLPTGAYIILSSLGENVTDQVTNNYTSNEMTVFDISGLGQGVYYLILNQESIRFVVSK